MNEAPATAPADEREETLAHRRILDTFAEHWDPAASTLHVGKTLTALSYCLGIVIAELTLRKVPWEIVDRNINKSMLRGVDRLLK
jgi:hypothetical protein